MNKMKFNAALVFFMLLTSNSWALDEWIENYNNTRSLGMGGASVAITSDDTALYRNPANMGSIRDLYGTVFDPEIEGTGTFTSTSPQIESAASTIASNPENYYRVKQQISPIIVRRNIGFGVLYNNEISAQANSADASLVDVHYKSDMAMILGTSLRLFDGIFKLGVAARAVNRIEVIDTALDPSASMALADIATEGSALAVDVGMLLQFPIALLPSLGVVVRDAGDTKFDVRDGVRLRATERPSTVKQSVDVAMSVFPIHSNTLRSVWTIEMSDVNNSRNDTDSAKKVHFGFELNTKDIFFLRLGYHQRYMTYGVEVASENLIWQVSSYGEEVGTAAASKEDRRLSMKLGLRF